MKLVLEQSEIEAALEAFVRTQISVPDNQIITVRPMLGEGGVLEASVYLNATSAPIQAPKSIPVPLLSAELPQAAPATRKPRAPKAESPFAAVARAAEIQAQVDETSNDAAVTGDFAAAQADEASEPVAEVLTNGTEQMAGRGITDSPEDRQPEPAPTAAAATPFSMFTKPAAVQAPAEEAAPAEVAKPKSIFSFGAKAAG